MIREEQINKAAFDYADTLEFPNPETRFGYEDIEFAFQSGAEWADSTYVKGGIEKESESYAQGVIGDISEDIRHLLATAYIAGTKRIER